MVFRNPLDLSAQAGVGTKQFGNLGRALHGQRPISDQSSGQRGSAQTDQPLALDWISGIKESSICFGA
ncbi:hypothetical protein QM298_10830 [Pseudomonas mendocina]|uniref:hypothetical protein n=1 Tax=Stutzerimonas nitrititolerans TaxID=2482751 RepID=UPI0028A856E9|nr:MULTISPECIES: hypothetical protein [Pseudomonadaceae]MDV5861402.1 hypothetical protein [Pseudomonas mendocina]